MPIIKNINKPLINAGLIISGILSLPFLLNIVNYAMVILLNAGILIGNGLRWIYEIKIN